MIEIKTAQSLIYHVSEHDDNDDDDGDDDNDDDDGDDNYYDDDDKEDDDNDNEDDKDDEDLPHDDGGDHQILNHDRECRSARDTLSSTFRIVSFLQQGHTVVGSGVGVVAQEHCHCSS